MAELSQIPELLEAHRRTRLTWELSGYERWIGVPMEQERAAYVATARALLKAAEAAELIAPVDWLDLAESDTIAEADELADKLAA